MRLQKIKKQHDMIMHTSSNIRYLVIFSSLYQNIDGTGSEINFWYKNFHEKECEVE